MILLSTYYISAASPPVNVKACQSSTSAPVEVSWSPPSSGAAIITGYRIFYHNQENIFVNSYVNSIIINFIEIKDELGEIFSIRSESTQLPSEPVNVMVTSEFLVVLSHYLFIYMALPDEIMCQCALSCLTNVGIAVGATTFTALVVVVVTTVTFLLCWLRYVEWWLLLA